MTQEEIRKQINFNNQQIEKLMNPTQFVLNPEIQRLIQNNKDLANQCKHEFVNGKCIYCDKEK